MAFEHDVLCAVCRVTLLGAIALADHAVYKCGELSYIELAHVGCAEADNAERDALYGADGWRWDA